MEGWWRDVASRGRMEGWMGDWWVGGWMDQWTTGRLRDEGGMDGWVGGAMEGYNGWIDGVMDDKWIGGRSMDGLREDG